MKITIITDSYSIFVFGTKVEDDFGGIWEMVIFYMLMYCKKKYGIVIVDFLLIYESTTKSLFYQKNAIQILLKGGKSAKLYFLKGTHIYIKNNHLKRLFSN